MGNSMKKAMKSMKKQQKKLDKTIRLEQATCPHVSKKGKTKLVPFQDGDVLKGRCKRCGEVVILDKEFLTNDMLMNSADVVKSALAEVRAAAYVGKVKISDKTMKMISEFDADVLRDLSSILQEINQAGKKDKKKKDKKGKKGKKGKNKKNKRERWS